MRHRASRLGKELIGLTVKHNGKLWVIVEYLSDKNVSACPIVNNKVHWRRRTFIGEDWKKTRRKPIEVKANNQAKPNSTYFHQFIDIPYHINYM